MLYASNNIMDSTIVSDNKKEVYLFFDELEHNIALHFISKKRKDLKIETDVMHYYQNKIVESKYTLLDDDWPSDIQIKEKSIFINQYDSYFPNGNLKTRTHFDNKGHKISMSRYHENGETFETRNFNDKGELILVENFDREGNSIIIEKYENEELISSVLYLENRKMSLETTLIRDLNAYLKRTYIKGILYQEEYVSSINNKNVGFHKYYYKENLKQLHYTKEYDSNGRKINIWKTFYEDGKIKEIDDYSANESTYIRQYFYPNGNLKKEGRVKLDDGETTVFDKEIGVWKFYNQNGKLIKEVDVTNE